MSKKPERTIPSVLVVDDDPDDLFIAERALKKSGVATVITARDGHEALILFKEHEASRRTRSDGFPPLLTLLDVNMPIMGGFEFVRALEALDLPEHETTEAIVMLSSSDAPHDRAAAEGLDRVRGYLVKPLTAAKASELSERFGRDFTDPAG